MGTPPTSMDFVGAGCKVVDGDGAVAGVGGVEFLFVAGDGEHVGEYLGRVTEDTFNFALDGIDDQDGGGKVAGDVELAGLAEFDAVGAVELAEVDFAGDLLLREIDDGDRVAAGRVVRPAGGAVVGDVDRLFISGEDELVGNVADLDAGDRRAVFQVVEADGIVVFLDDEEEREENWQGVHLGIRVYRDRGRLS